MRGPGGNVVRILGHYPGLSARPVHHVDGSATTAPGLEWVFHLRSYSSEIEAELLGLLSEERGDPSPLDSSWETFRLNEKGLSGLNTGWEHIPLIDNFRLLPSSCSLFPRTSRILEETSDLVPRLGPRHVAIARQRGGGTGLGTHSDLLNFFLTMHLPIVVPEGEGEAGVVVDGIKKSWVAGEPIGEFSCLKTPNSNPNHESPNN